MVHMDLNETKLREAIEFWERFIAKARELDGEPLLKMARESLAIAEKQLQCCLLAKGIVRSAKEKRNTGRQGRFEMFAD